MAPSRVENRPIEAFDKEALVQRNPRIDFAAVQGSRPSYNHTQTWQWTKTTDPNWQPGDGATSSTWKDYALFSIDPHSPTRTHNQNYKIMISSTVTRPIALVSSVSPSDVQILAPFSYFNAVSVDPPLYSVSFVGTEPNDSLTNVLESGECCISIVSDWFLEAVNFPSVNTPRHIGEWRVSGLHPKPSIKVHALHVGESAFSIEYKVGEDGEWVRTATLVLFEAVMYHVRDDAIDEKMKTVDIGVLRPVWRGGGITYGSCFGGWKTERPKAFRELNETQRVQSLNRS
ncbi:hypothetical protein BU23DRAFT_659559 [Bimuria novae-zelandiae CBS 107.79]|uniref:Flavin reductase like domain-containing protein n=1 Tax=Bimuria novae-zelandiae CBS 107.79 TaxID=1447943 RepID=A0A6A5VVT1_9PLEO|nr:hypothetical protein BU23DRAFT_659559 [Bimuria novae-zelandiae CBS 107.79]